MAVIETETAETKIANVTGMVVAAADGMMTMVPENDTTTVMGMMTLEAKEGTKARPYHQCINRVSSHSTNGLSVGTYLYSRFISTSPTRIQRFSHVV
jgi:hypothetical protein